MSSAPRIGVEIIGVGRLPSRTCQSCGVNNRGIIGTSERSIAGGGCRLVMERGSSRLGTLRVRRRR